MKTNLRNFKMFLETLSTQDFHSGIDEYKKNLKEVFSDFDDKTFKVKIYKDEEELLSKLDISVSTSYTKQGYDVSIGVRLIKESYFSTTPLEIKLSEKYLYLRKDGGLIFDQEQIMAFRRLFDRAKNYIGNPIEMIEMYNKLEWFGRDAQVDYSVKIN